MSAPQLSVVIVTWNCVALLVACLESVRARAGAVTLELIVVDNASADETLATLAAQYPEVRVIANPDNVGFARASNQGIAASSGEFICLLNPDTELSEPDTLARLHHLMCEHPEVGMAGCRLVFPDGTHQVGDAGYLPTPAAAIAHALLLTRISPRVPGLFLQDRGPRPGFQRVAWVCGACTIVRRRALAKVGGLDASYFLYGEDVEWGCRMTQGGVSVGYFSSVSIVHHQGGTQRGKGLPGTRWLDGLARVYVVFNHGRGWWRFRAFMALGFLLRAAVQTLRGSARGAEMLAYARHVWQLKESAVGEAQCRQ